MPNAQPAGRLLPAIFLLLAAAPAPLAQVAPYYRVTFESTWSAVTHPEDFPPDPHFSGLVGAVHAEGVSLWAPGALASEGIESMAETGSKTLLIAEVEALIAAGQAEAVISGGGIALSPGVVVDSFYVFEGFPLVSLVSMLAPSPDWFVGVTGLDLRDGNGWWVGELVVPLYVYDAGTDSGTTYTAPDQDTDPPIPIFQHTDPPFLVNGTVPPVGTFTFTLVLPPSAMEEPAEAAAFALDAPFPNPAPERATLRLHLATPQPVTVEALDALGRRVAVLHDGLLTAGTHPLTLDVSDLPVGVYVVRVQGEDAQGVRRVVVGGR